MGLTTECVLLWYPLANACCVVWADLGCSFIACQIYERMTMSSLWCHRSSLSTQPFVASNGFTYHALPSSLKVRKSCSDTAMYGNHARRWKSLEYVQIFWSSIWIASTIRHMSHSIPAHDYHEHRLLLLTIPSRLGSLYKDVTHGSGTRIHYH